MSHGYFIIPLVDTERRLSQTFFNDAEEIPSYKNMTKTVAAAIENVIKSHLSEFPDFREDAFIGDFKSAICSLYADTKGNHSRSLPIGYLCPGGCADLYKLEEYKMDIENYLETGKLSEHLTAMLVFAIYEYKYDEKTGEKYAIIYDVLVLPALFCINFRKSGKVATRSGKVTIGFYERNIDFISQKNFGI